MGNLCRDCFVETAPGALRCTHCHGKRLISHRSWRTLTIAHIDCDAFYAAIEKRENPTLKNKPVIVGGGHRGVVATCCYIARLSGVKSAMPMFKALALCPQAVVIKPNMALYAQVSKQMRAMLDDLSPAIEQISIDEAFIDMTGTAQVHKSPPAKILAQFQHHVEKTLGISISIGLAPNKFLAKFASDLDKPRGFSLIDAEEAPHILAPLPITRIAGIGAATARKLNARGVESVADLQALDIKSAFQLLGSDANHWIERAWGRDARTVTNERIRKSLSAERTFDTDISDHPTLETHLRAAAQKVGAGLRAKSLVAIRVSVKAKTAAFKTVTRSLTLTPATASSAALFTASQPLLKGLVDGTAYRLLGLSVDVAEDTQALSELGLDPSGARTLRLEKTVDSLKHRFGQKIVLEAAQLPQRDKSKP
jgi:DNA polymerase IV